MPTYGDTDNLTDYEEQQIASAEQGYAAFLSTCRPEDVAEMQRRHTVSLLADNSGKTPSTAGLGKLLRGTLESQAGSTDIGEPRSVESLLESREELDRRGGALAVAYDRNATAESKERPKPPEEESPPSP